MLIYVKVKALKSNHWYLNYFEQLIQTNLIRIYMFSVIFESEFLSGFKRFWVNKNNKIALSALLSEAIEYKGPFQLERVSFVRCLTLSLGVDLRAPDFCISTHYQYMTAHKVLEYRDIYLLCTDLSDHNWPQPHI